MVIIKLTFNKFERNKKMSLQFIQSSDNDDDDECFENDEIKGKYYKEKLNKIIKYEKKIMKIIIGNLNQVIIIVLIF